ncbi:MAG: NAD-dependent deacylase [Flammeovirgaceae bacterium]|jgi:NAD-dependent deacetylase|nr:NAD-dependent deacylase [Flammeovirgaceae bacterium]|tara:strand:- start:3505 stop:4197 length:693 start_codon:yes stop_codon:yes gene_type:complete
MPKLVVLTGAGISAESGLKTFRDSNGLWEGYDVSAVATPEGWSKNTALVLDFYNQRRKQALKAVPNQGHLELVKLQSDHEVVILTQNVDNLHERAGSHRVIHLHGSLFKSRSTKNPKLIYNITGDELNIGDHCPLDSQLRPDIVWFGEEVPLIDQAIIEVKTADVFLIIGTSLQVYPAASLIHFVSPDIPKIIVDLNIPTISRQPNLYFFEESATIGVVKAAQLLSRLIN